MRTLTVNLTDAQVKALETDIVDLGDWLSAWPAAKANALIDSIAQTELMRRLEEGLPMLASKDDLVMAAPVLSAANRNGQAFDGIEASQ